jgi:hypothetical protein
MMELKLKKEVMALFETAFATKLGQGKGAWIAFLVCFIFLCGCGMKLPFVKDSEDTAQRVILKNPPKSIAILPFGNQTEQEDINEFVRTTFYSHLSAQPYKDIELNDVDERLKRYHLTSYDKLSEVPPKRLGQILSCDAVVIGKVTEYQKVYAGLYSQMAVGASITVWDTRTGKKIWSDEHVTRNHEGGIPLAITDIAMIGIRSGLNLTESEKIATVDELSRYLTGRIPLPDVHANEKTTKLVSLKRLTKAQNQAADSSAQSSRP